MSKMLIITRKIQLVFNTKNPEEKNQYYNTIRRWQYLCVEAANLISSFLYLNLQQNSLTFLYEKVRKQIERGESWDLLEKKELKQLEKEENQDIYKLVSAEEKARLEATPISVIYTLLSNRYKTHVKTAILSALSRIIVQSFDAEKKDYIMNKKSLRSYKKGMPIPFTSDSIRTVHHQFDDNNKEYRDIAFSLFSIPFRTRFGNDRSNNEFYFKECMSEWFLPSFIHDIESQLSDLIIGSRVANFTVDINGIVYKFNYCRIDRTDHYYQVVTPGEDGRSIIFKMNPFKYKEADFDADINYKLQYVKSKNQYKAPGEYRIVSNYKLCDSSLTMEKKQEQKKTGERINVTKIFLLAAIQFEQDRYKEDFEKNTAECELDISIPIIVRIKNKEYKIGSKDDFLFRRTGIQGAYRNTQRDLKGVKGGRGRRKKLKALNKYEKYEKNVVKDKLHNYSKELIKICLENQVKYIYLKNQAAKEKEAKENEFILRNWSYGGLKALISYKADRHDLEIIVDKESEEEEPVVI